MSNQSLSSVIAYARMSVQVYYRGTDLDGPTKMLDFRLGSARSSPLLASNVLKTSLVCYTRATISLLIGGASNMLAILCWLTPTDASARQMYWSCELQSGGDMGNIWPVGLVTDFSNQKVLVIKKNGASELASIYKEGASRYRFVDDDYMHKIDVRLQAEYALDEKTGGLHREVKVISTLDEKNDNGIVTTIISRGKCIASKGA